MKSIRSRRVKTRNGRDADIIAVDKRKKYGLTAYIHGTYRGYYIDYMHDGRLWDNRKPCDLDLILAEE